MAAPTAPTLATLVSEGLKKAGHASPAAALSTRAQDYWIEEIKNDIFTLAKKLRSLQTTGVTVTDKGLWRYSFPSDFSSHISLTRMYGSETGTAQAGAAGTLTLKADAGHTEEWMLGKEILITSGTGSSGLSQCTAYNPTTKVATVTPNWPTTPDSTSTYMIVDEYIPLTEGPIWNMEDQVYETSKGPPTHFRIIGDADYGEFILTPPPDETYYGLKLRYYANLMTIDLAGTLMATLYYRWRNLWISGVKWKCLEFDDDDRQQVAMQQYQNHLREMLMREQYGYDLSNLSATIED